MTLTHKNVIYGLGAIAFASVLSIFISQSVLNDSQEIRKSAAPETERNTQATNRQIPVLVIQYFPENPQQPGYLDQAITNSSEKIDTLRSRLSEYTQSILSDLTTASIYKGYTNPNGQPSLHYIQHGATIEYKEKLPRSNFHPGGIGKENIYRPDYVKILNRENICDYVDNKGVKQVWLWGYHYGDIEPTESNMSMGSRSKDFFNRGTYGDISNSEGANDLPQCKNTYALMNYNFTRGVAEALEDHGHHLEAILRWMDEPTVQQTTTKTKPLFWDRFVGNPDDSIANLGCGSIHVPPNGIKAYDWFRTESKTSDCLDWKPDGSGAKTQISCSTWTRGSCPDDTGRAYKIWWMQNLPGLQNGLKDGLRTLRNWWDLIYDLDTLLMEGGGMYYPDTSVKYRLEENATGVITIQREPSLPDNRPLILTYVDSKGRNGRTTLFPVCTYTTPTPACTYNLHPILSPTDGWKSWQIEHDPFISYTTPATIFSSTLHSWKLSSETPATVTYRTPFVRTVVTPPTPKCTFDANIDGKNGVDIDDYVLFVQNVLREGTNIPGDIDCSGKVDIDDYPYLMRNFSIQ